MPWSLWLPYHRLLVLSQKYASVMVGTLPQAAPWLKNPEGKRQLLQDGLQMGPQPQEWQATPSNKWKCLRLIFQRLSKNGRLYLVSIWMGTRCVRVDEEIFLPLFLSGLYPPPPSMSSRSLSEKPRKKRHFSDKTISESRNRINKCCQWHLDVLCGTGSMAQWYST